MNTNKIILDIPPILSRITGNDYGLKIYQEQVKPNIDENKINEIIFPQHITGISISFIKGLMGEEIKKYGKEKLLEHFKFTSPYVDVEESIIDSINF